MLYRTKASLIASILIAGAVAPVSGAFAQLQYLSRTGTLHIIAGSTDHAATFTLASGDVNSADMLQTQPGSCSPGSRSSASVQTTLCAAGLCFVGNGTATTGAALCGNRTPSMSRTAEDITFAVTSTVHVSFTGTIDGCASLVEAVQPSLAVSLSGNGIQPIQVAGQGSMDHDFSYCLELAPGTYRLVASAESNTASIAPEQDFSAAFGVQVHLDIVDTAALAPTPSRAAVCPGGQTTLTIPGSGSASFTYQWRRGGASIADDAHFGGSASGALRITGMTPALAGTYDCVVTSICGQTVTAASTVSYCAADFNCSGDITTQDILDFLTAWFNSDPRADTNGADGINAQDIFDFLGSWFSGCA